MNLDTILFALSVSGMIGILLWGVGFRIDRKMSLRLKELDLEFNDTLQLIKDKVDADAEINDARYSGLHQNLATVDLKLSALGRAAGFVLENGLWQKQKPVSGKATPAKKPATATKKTTRGGK